MSCTKSRARELAGAVLAIGLVTAALTTPPASSAAADDTASRWAGYRIPSTGKAAGGWIGGYRVDGTPVYVITPTRRPNRAGFGARKATDDLAGKRASRRDTARAAWILSKYGGYKDDVQAAAVDAAVLHLLAGRGWKLGNRRGAARVRASGDSATVRRFASLMLQESRASAGPYEAVVTPTSADVGGVTSVTVTVTDGHDGPVAGLPVSVTSPEGGASQPAAGPVEAVTGDDGRAVVRLAAPLAGWRTVTARIEQVPEHRLVVRRPDRKGQAKVAEGGVRRTLVASAAAPVRGPQSLALAPVPGSLVVGGQAAVAVTAQGDGTARSAAGTLHGPFAAASSAVCSGADAGRVAATLPGDGTHVLPAVRPPAGGYYVWQVDVAATATSLPGTSCGAVVRVRAKPALTVAAPPTATPGNVRVAMRVAGMPFPMKVDLTLQLFGPLAPGSPSCDQPVWEASFSRLGDGQVESGDIWVGDPGRYAWRVEAAPGDLWLGGESTCGAPGSMTEVQ